MNREQRRKMEREKTTAAKAISNLSPKQLELIDDITTAKADEMFKERMQDVEVIMSRCVSAIFIDLFPNKNWQEICDIENRLTEFLIEDTAKWKALFEGKDEKMAKKVMKEIEEKVHAKCVELIEKNVKQRESIEILVSSFPTLSKAMLVTKYKNVKEEVEPDKTASDEEVKKATDYIFGEKEVQDPKEKLKDNKDNLVCERVEEIKVSNLKVVKKVLEVEGQFGTYTVNENGVTTGEENFKSVEDLRKYKEKEMKLFEMRCNEIEEVFGLA